MRELEFLPAWYPQVRQRKRLVFLQGWLTLILVGGMAAFMLMADRNIAEAQQVLAGLETQLRQTNSQLAEMDKLDAMRRQLSQQAQITSRLGLYVEACALIQELERLMPKQMSLTQLQMENEERTEQSALHAAKGGRAAAPADRKLRVKLHAVCPTAVDMASFLTQLSTVRFFEQVNLNRAGETGDKGHTMHEFEVTLVLNLNGGTGQR